MFLFEISNVNSSSIAAGFAGNTTFSISTVNSRFAPPTGAEIDHYYSVLFTRIVSQQVFNNFGELDILQGTFSNRPFINGIFEIFYQGLLEVQDYSKEITIKDFNSEENDKYQLSSSITFRKYVKLTIPRQAILTSFTSNQALVDFVEDMIMQIVKTFADYYFKQKAAVLADEKLLDATKETISPVYDKYINTTGLNIEKKLQLIKQTLLSLQTPSNDHLGITNPKIKYSSSGDTLYIIFPAKERALIASFNAQTYNYEQLGFTVKTKTLDFNLVDDLDKTEAAKISFIILSEKALIQGFQIESASSILNLPKMQSIMETHNWYGFASLPVYPKYMFKEVDSSLETKITDFNNSVPADPNDTSRKLWQISYIASP